MRVYKIIAFFLVESLLISGLQAQSINSISAVSTITEGSENGGQIAVSLTGVNTFIPVINPAKWTVGGLPLGVGVGSITHDTISAIISLVGNRIKDYDEAQMIIVNIQANQFQNGVGSTLKSKSSNSILTFINDPASIAFTTGSVCEGAENNTVIEVVLTGGSFPPILDSSKWVINNLPTGITVGHVSKINMTTAHITLSGNTSVFYSSDISLNLIIDTTQYDDHTLIPVNLSPVSGTFTLRALAALTSTLIPGAMCSNSVFSYTPTSATAGATFAWTRSVVAGISNLTSSGTGNPSETLVNTTTSPVSVTYVYTLSANGCTNPSTYNIVLTVNPIPAVTNSVTATTCDGSGLNISLTASMPSIFIWTKGAVTGGITGASSGSGNTINQILVNPGNVSAGTVQYLVTPTSISGFCTGSAYTITATVNPTPALTSTLNPAAIYSNSLFSYIPTSSTAGTSFSWTRANVAGITNLASSGTGNPNETLTDSLLIPLNVTYSYILTANSCTNSSTYNVVVKINPAGKLILSGSANESNENGAIVKVSLQLGIHYANTLNPANWTITGLPKGVTTSVPIRKDTITAQITLSGNRTVDYDSNKSLSVVITGAEYTPAGGGSLAANSGFTFLANNDPASLSLTTDSIREGTEDSKTIEVKISGGTFRTILNPSKWIINNLPNGVTVGSVNQIDPNTAKITLSGNRTLPYYSDINLQLDIDTSQYDDHSLLPFNLSPVSGSFVLKALLNQVITFNALPAKTYADTSLVLNATTSSSLQVTFRSSDTTIAKIIGTRAIFRGTGIDTIYAQQPGDNIYGPALSVYQLLVVNKIQQTIVFDSIPVKTYGDIAFNLLAVSTSGLPVNFNINNPALAGINGKLVSILSVGKDTIFASQPGNNYYAPAAQVFQILQVNKSVTIINKYNMIGYVKNSLTQDTLKYGYIRLFALEDSLHAHLIDSVVIELDGSFKFIEPDSNYLVQVIPDNNIYPELIPTYYGDKSIWSDASIIRPSVTLSPYNIICNGLAPLTGIGVITGFVGDMMTKLKNAGRPMKGASVVLIGKSTKGNPIIAVTETDSLGNYQFVNIPDGTYSVVINIEGISIPNPQEVILSPSARVADNISYAVTDIGIVPQSQVSGIKINSSDISLYPNPVNDNLYIEFKNSGMKIIRIFQMNGMLMSEIQTINQNTDINVSQFSSGVYLVCISSGTDIYRKLIVKR
jgi:hypothetical protein